MLLLPTGIENVAQKEGGRDIAGSRGGALVRARSISPSRLVAKLLLEDGIFGEGWDSDD